MIMTGIYEWAATLGQPDRFLLDVTASILIRAE
jgi:hypothetical protein